MTDARRAPSDVKPMRFALDRLFADEAPYKAAEIAVVLCIVKAMSLDDTAGTHVSFLSYARIAKRTRLSIRTVSATIEAHCESSPAPLLARSFAKMTRGKLHRSYRWTLITAPESFAIQRDLRQKRAKRPASGAAAKKRERKAEAPTPSTLAPQKPVQVESSYRCFRCDCGSYVVERGGIGRNYNDDQLHVCGFTPADRADRQELHTSDRQNLPTNTSELAGAFVAVSR